MGMEYGISWIWMNGIYIYIDGILPKYNGTHTVVEYCIVTWILMEYWWNTMEFDGISWDFMPDEHIIYNILKTLFHLFYSFLGLTQWNIKGYTMDINGLWSPILGTAEPHKGRQLCLSKTSCGESYVGDNIW